MSNGPTMDCRWDAFVREFEAVDISITWTICGTHSDDLGLSGSFGSVLSRLQVNSSQPKTVDHKELAMMRFRDTSA